MRKEYPLLCNFCNTKQLVGDRKIYHITVHEILLNDNDDKEEYPHKNGDVRWLQICENCLKNSDIGIQLDKENRSFK